ncbi:MAG TPA: hypothetical protein VGW38_14660 [Chloroflexota bacterium]|nr:hypothetical protein [Chloroflexota bacterium]
MDSAVVRLRVAAGRTSHQPPARSHWLRLLGAAVFFALVFTWSIAPVWRSLRDSLRPHAVADDLMAPAVPLGALALTERVAVGQLQPNDIILYQHPERSGAPVLLRVTEIEPSQALRGPGKVLTLRRDSPAMQEIWEVELHGAAWRLVATVPYLAPLAAVAEWLPSHLTWQHAVLTSAAVTATLIALQRSPHRSPLPDPLRW